MNTDNFVKFLSEMAGDMDQKSQDTRTISFSELNSRVSPLPRSAYKHRAWWANHGSKAWLKVGFRTEAVDMERQLVTFRRTRSSPVESGTPYADDKKMHHDFHDEAGRFRFPVKPGDQDSPHPLVGALRGKIRIAPDFDLTAPADPEWGRVYDE